MAGSINYTKLLAKLDPQPGGEDTARMRTGLVDAINADGTVDLGISGIVLPDVPKLDGVVVVVGQVVNVISYRGSLLVIGASATEDSSAGGFRLVKRADSASSLGAIGATEVTLISVADVPFRAGRAYEIKWRTRMTAGSAGLNNFRVRRDTALSGSLIGSYQIYQATTGQLYVPQDSFYVKAAADVTHDIHLSLTHSAGTATPSGAADTVRYLEVYEVGLYGDYTNAEDV